MPMNLINSGVTEQNLTKFYMVEFCFAVDFFILTSLISEMRQRCQETVMDICRISVSFIGRS